MPQGVKASVGRPRLKTIPDQIEDLRRQGLSLREIARRTGMGYGSVRRACATIQRSIDSQHSTPDSPTVAGGQI